MKMQKRERIDKSGQDRTLDLKWSYLFLPILFDELKDSDFGNKFLRTLRNALNG